jgi:hypothetical protein
MPSYGNDQFILEVPIDLSQIGADADAQELRVVARARDGSLTSGTVTGEAGGRVSVSLAFPERPGPLQVLVGPASATESQLVNLQTISVNVPGRTWGDARVVTVEPVAIAPFYWWWWLEWCRRFVIRGRVVCDDGSPVPYATVCAYDLDWWFWWTSTELLGCATTDINGAFEIDFTWCCGWWPWWWWRSRVWQISQELVGLISGVLEQDPRIALGRSGLQPSLSVFSTLDRSRAVPAAQTLAPADIPALEGLRRTLGTAFPESAELAALRIWPWWPWGPWWDCNPDVIFKVTQDCGKPGTVILQEGFGQVRSNIPQVSQVILVANDLACCRRPCPEPCLECEGIDIANICQAPVTDVGGNLGALPAPAGRLGPGAVAPVLPVNAHYAGEPPAALWNGDRAFAGTVTVSNANIVTGVDYYEIQYWDGSAWADLPPGAAENFNREWLVPSGPFSFTTLVAPFAFTSRTVAGSSPPKSVTVVETRERYEATTGLPPGAFGVQNEWLVVPINSTVFADGTYQFRVVGWNDNGSGQVTNPRVLRLCDSERENGWVLTFNNRVDPDPSASSPCGGVVPVHLCVTEPDTAIYSVRLNGVEISDCSTIDAASGTLEIEFLAQDLTGNLAYYTLDALDGTTFPSADLLHQPSSVLTHISGDSAGPTYGEALATGATAPVWTGGRMRLTVDAAQAFAGPCCFQIKLTAYSRTVVSCDGDLDYYNYSQFAIGVGVCPPPRLLADAPEPGGAS